MVAAVSFGECCAGGGVSGSRWRATEILEIRRRGREKNENRLDPRVRSEVETRGRGDSGREWGCPGVAERSWGEGRRWEVEATRIEFVSVHQRTGEKVVKGRENPRGVQNGRWREAFGDERRAERKW